MIFKNAAALPAEPPYLARPVLVETFNLVWEWMIRHGETDDSLDSAMFAGVDHEGPFWHIALEGGPEDWPWHFSQDPAIRRALPDGVHIEALNHWALGLYPTDG